MKSAKKATSPVSDRVRAIAAERGLSIRQMSEAIGWHETQLGVILRRLDSGGNMRSDVQEEIAKGIGRSVQWLMTGAETEAEGTLIERLPGWEEARRDAAGRVSDEALDVVAKWRVSSPPERIEVAFVLALARAWADACMVSKR